MPRPKKTGVQDTALLEAALEGFELQKKQIEERIAEVRRMLGGRRAAPKPAAAPEASTQPAARKRRAMTAAARKRIAAAQKKRWAAFHAKQKKESAD